MKFTKSYLKQVIKEELEKLEEAKDVVGAFMKKLNQQLEAYNTGNTDVKRMQEFVDFYKRYSTQLFDETNIDDKNKNELNRLIQELQNLLNTAGSVVNPSDWSSVSGAEISEQQTSKSPRTIPQGHRTAIKKFYKKSSKGVPLTSQSLTQHNEKVDATLKQASAKIQAISDIIKSFMGRRQDISQTVAGSTSFSKTRGKY